MKATGRTLYISGQVSHLDFDTSDPALGMSEGLVSVWENERRGYGYLIKRVAAFPSPHTIELTNMPFIVTTYSKRDLEAIRGVPGGPTAAGLNILQQILGMLPGIGPAENDRVVASYTPTLSLEGVVKSDALVVQGLSIGFDDSKGSVSYYIELEEYDLSDDENVLALLQESSMNVANFTF